MSRLKMQVERKITEELREYEKTHIKNGKILVEDAAEYLLMKECLDAFHRVDIVDANKLETLLDKEDLLDYFARYAKHANIGINSNEVILGGTDALNVRFK